MTTTAPGLAPVLGRISGQTRAVRVLSGALQAPVHAYLFLGPPGSGKRKAALAFAAALVCPNGGCGNCPACRDTLAGRHPDVTEIERRGASILVGDARAVAALAQRTPAVAARQVIILDDFHLVDEAAPALLKTIEEPPSSTVFIVLADALPPSLVTIASRCVSVPFGVLDEDSVAGALIEGGTDPTLARSAAVAAHGRLDRAVLLVDDPGFAVRQSRWRTIPEQLDGTGATVARIVGELLAEIEALVVVVRSRHTAELERLAAEAESRGERGLPGRQQIEAGHRREQRRIRIDELRAGLATVAGAYRGRLAGGALPPRRVASVVQACDRVDEAAKWLERNPNERLFLEALLIDLDRDG